ncbi:CbrC family protein [Marinicella rhabdoformis]|uniref:CbrC family protein n=1 Tax=Marinicella rhabdoformis TaxID=2580566 RepID=UPI0015CFB78D|nr:CbrC family protein [Marinicella rhabdoformis]
MEFRYFRDPEGFAFLVDSPQPCSVCSKVGVWFDTGGYAGINEIDCICEACLKSGKLIDLEIEANQYYDDDSEESVTLMYKTPALPTLQETAWPLVDGELPVFERIASKQDFESKDEFLKSFSGEGHEVSEIEWLWDRLPEKKLNSYKDAGDVSVYLFTLKGNKYWMWDAN